MLVEPEMGWRQQLESVCLQELKPILIQIVSEDVGIYLADDQKCISSTL